MTLDELERLRQRVGAAWDEARAIADELQSVRTWPDAMRRALDYEAAMERYRALHDIWYPRAREAGFPRPDLDA
jgi:hypothetical protein